MPKVAIQFPRFGPYHLARVSSAVSPLSSIGWEVIGIESTSTDDTYAWQEEKDTQVWPRITVLHGKERSSVNLRMLSKKYVETLNKVQPDAILINGWTKIEALTCLRWCRINGSIPILASETREVDGKRIWFKEQVKKHRIRHFDSALVGGISHREYLVKLGFPSNQIHTGYNVVNNEHFRSESDRFRVEDSNLRYSSYFLASNRFIERKNLLRLIKAYSSSQYGLKEKWDLCLLGDGPQRDELISQCSELNLDVQICSPWEAPKRKDGRGRIFLPGFRQINELPRFYAHASCFVHPANSEPWGLVINEAMAASLPILSSYNVGAAEELIEEGVNGWRFSPSDTDSIAEKLREFTLLDPSVVREMGKASHRIISNKLPTEIFGRALKNILLSR